MIFFQPMSIQFFLLCNFFGWEIFYSTFLSCVPAIKSISITSYCRSITTFFVNFIFDSNFVLATVRLITFFIRYISPIMQQIICNLLHIICWKMIHIIILILFPVIISFKRNNSVRCYLNFGIQSYLPNNICISSFFGVTSWTINKF